ncbi:MAG: universal stress protein [Verrucomicrobiota bacterium]
MNTEATILACTDGSTYAPSIYDHAIWVAQRLKIGIHVLHMIDPAADPTSLHNFSGSIGIDSRRILKEELVKLEEAHGRVAQAKAAAILEAARAHLRQAGFTNFTADARHGRLTESVDEYEVGAELVVIGKRGEAADFERLHLGANVERVIRTCRHPVLVASRAFKPIQRVLIAYDGGPSARKALDYTATSSLLRGLECHLLAVGKPHSKIAEDLQAAHERLESTGHKIEHHHLTGHAEDVFADFIQQNKIDLLIMGAYGHSRIRQLIVGSTTTTMVRTCRIPVLMFR